MTDFNPSLNVDTSKKQVSTIIQDLKIPEKPQFSVFDKMQLNAPMAVSSIDATNKNVMVNQIINSQATLQSQDSSATAYISGLNGFTSKNDGQTFTHMPMSTGNLGGQVTQKLNSQLKLYEFEGISYNTDYRGHNSQNNNSIWGASYDVANESRTASMSATVFGGGSLEHNDGLYEMAPIKGWMVSGAVQKNFTGKEQDIELGAKGSILETQKGETNTRVIQGGVEVKTPDILVTANGSVTDANSPGKTSRSYQAGVNIITTSDTNQYAIAEANTVPHTPVSYDKATEQKVIADKKNEAKAYGIEIGEDDTLETIQAKIDMKTIVDPRLKAIKENPQIGIGILASADSDNLGNRSRSFGLNFREGNTFSVGADVKSNSSVDKVTGNTKKSTDVMLNAAYTW